jgi:hypothetical protein
MTLSGRIKSLTEWGKQLALLTDDQKESLFLKAENKNRWFTRESCSRALGSILPWLKEETLMNWAKNYTIAETTDRTVGLVMAGNIPLVGFHDFLCVLVAGHHVKAKLSSQDNELLPYLTEILFKVDEHWRSKVSFEERLQGIDAVIATGSDNSARYFEYYFRTIPKIIRKNRTSVAVIMGEEAQEEFKDLGLDVFTYFGMGCRNVSKVYIPKNFDLEKLRKPFDQFHTIINHSKYANNYDYQRAIRLVSNKPFLEFSHLIVEESLELVSPVAVLYYEPYTSQEQLQNLLAKHESKIQCTVSAKGWFKGSVPFGKAQTPDLTDYADGIDTMKFLETV